MSFQFKVKEVFAMPPKPAGMETWSFSRNRPNLGIAFGLFEGEWVPCFFDGENLRRGQGVVEQSAWPKMFLVLPHDGSGQLQALCRASTWSNLATCPHCGDVAGVITAQDRLKGDPYYYVACARDGQISPRRGAPEQALQGLLGQRVFRTWLPDEEPSRVVSIAAPHGIAAANERMRQEIGFDVSVKTLGTEKRITVQELGGSSWIYNVAVTERPTIMVVGP